MAFSGIPSLRGVGPSPYYKEAIVPLIVLLLDYEAVLCVNLGQRFFEVLSKSGALRKSIVPRREEVYHVTEVVFIVLGDDNWNPGLSGSTRPGLAYRFRKLWLLLTTGPAKPMLRARDGSATPGFSRHGPGWGGGGGGWQSFESGVARGSGDFLSCRSFHHWLWPETSIFRGGSWLSGSFF